jgi:hypothetical protein
MSRFARRPNIHPRPRDNSRQTAVVVAIAAFLALGLLATGGYVAARQRPAVVATASDDDEIYTGSILYMPDEGRICRQLLFDNHTGRLRDNGSVDCERATYRGSSDTPKQWSVARVRVISSGFRDR